MLVIAGTDSSGGAGLSRDVAVLAAHAVTALPVVTAVTAQTHRDVRAVHVLPATLIRTQIEAALAEGDIGAIKIGMLADRETVEVVSQCLKPSSAPIVLDPVLAASSGKSLLDEAGRIALIQDLLPQVALLTPNIPEAAALLGTSPARNEAEQLEHAQHLRKLGARAVLVKGGHADGDEAVDVLVTADDTVTRLTSKRFPSSPRGTGCALASAIAAGLANGKSLLDACYDAKHFLTAMHGAQTGIE